MKPRVLFTFYPLHLAIMFLFDPHDIWVGVYVPGRSREMGRWRYSFYVCIVPLFPINIVFFGKRHY